MSTKVGADIESICGKCGDVWHVVVAIVGSRIAKVQCKQCGSLHRHRPPERASTDAPSSVPRAASGGAASKSPRAASTGASRKRTKAEPPLPEIRFNPDLPLRRYSPMDVFAVGDQIEHPKFGVGVVEHATDPGKMQVIFIEGGRKVLAQAKTGLVLDHPAPLSFNDAE